MGERKGVDTLVKLERERDGIWDLEALPTRQAGGKSAVRFGVTNGVTGISSGGVPGDRFR